MHDITKTGLLFPHEAPPPTAQVIEIAPGILWTRIPLPFRLDHVNIYLIEDGDGFAILDTGIGNKATQEVWEALVAGPLAGRRITRLIVSHFHPGPYRPRGLAVRALRPAAARPRRRPISAVSTSRSAPARWMQNRIATSTRITVSTRRRRRSSSTQGHGYLRMVNPLPPTFVRVVAGDVLRIGGREFRVLTGDGHAPEQIMLWCEADNIFLAADQVLAKITPNVSVWAVDPEGDPLGLFLRSLRAIRETIPADALVLPGHQLPFHGLHTRIDELIAHHDERCDAIANACGSQAKSVADLVPVLFPRALDPHQMSFAFSEALAHVNYMLRSGRLLWADADGEVERVRAASPPRLSRKMR